ncbi:MAG: diaminopimelate epimerase [Deltaproteobacteria bacterium]|nr:diaminopimelate epimerase [Deltaproteobacteria bacterium]
MQLNFEKWHGCQNDFIITQIQPSQKTMLIPSLQRQAAQLCSRNGDGIGADGILVLSSDSQKRHDETEMTIINRDGSLAANCGNGLRCASGFLFRQKERSAQRAETEYTEIRVGPLHFSSQICSWDAQQQSALICLTMPAPLLDQQCSWYQEAETLVQRLRDHPGQPQISYREEHCCDSGNPHLVLLTEAPAAKNPHPGADCQDFRGSDGLNVHLAWESPGNPQIIRHMERRLQGTVGEHYDARSWERGVGESRACGSGACAIAVSVLSAELVSREEWIMITMPGGPLLVQQRDEGGAVLLAGDACFVFQGTVEI